MRWKPWGSIYRSQGLARKAIPYLEQALAIDQETGDRLSEHVQLCNMGNAYADLGKPGVAYPYPGPG